jgi:hypothetical protein
MSRRRIRACSITSTVPSPIFGRAKSLRDPSAGRRFDQATAKQLAPRGEFWTPDLCRELISPKLTAADALGLPTWLGQADIIQVVLHGHIPKTRTCYVNDP